MHRIPFPKGITHATGYARIVPSNSPQVALHIFG
jgi:hypothetical protein